MAIERVRDYFRQFGMEDKIMEFVVSSATVELAAKAVGCEPKRITKTLSFKIGDKPILIAVAGDAKVDNAKYKSRFGAKAKMLTPEEVLEYTGHAIGGVCPFGVIKDIDVYLDISMKRFKTVFPACGSDNSAIELDIEQMENYTNYLEWVDVCKNWEIGSEQDSGA